jgi:hypothetical protein
MGLHAGGYTRQMTQGTIRRYALIVHRFEMRSGRSKKSCSSKARRLGCGGLTTLSHLGTRISRNLPYQ